MKPFLSYFLTLLICLFACQSDSQATDDITLFDWKLVSIELENESIIISEGSYVKDSSYVLKFRENSTFSLDTSINIARGSYLINGHLIELTDYQELTEAATNDPEQLRINGLLVQRLGQITEFNTNQDNLTLVGINNTFILKKMN